MSSHSEYVFYQLENIKDVDIPKTFEEIFKFPEGELSFQQDIKSTFHYRYFANYLFYDDNGLKIKTIVVEKNYTCLTFLEDYINYYAHCYTKYEKSCRRIHLFYENFDKTTFQNMLCSESEEQYSKFWESYSGCIVIKPLPTGIIGVTYLKTYKGDEKRNRYYTAISSQKINLYGTSRKIDTMPFIEQDRRVSSCASAALWMAFQKTSEIFHTRKTSPSEITLLAGFDSNNTGKIFPSKGLAIDQICKAIYNNGLHSELRSEAIYNNGLHSELRSEAIYNNGLHSELRSGKKIIDRSLLQGFVYAYLKAEIPILLGIEIESSGGGSHLITLNGYRFKFDNEKITQKNDYKSQLISKFYAHDDQTGPFSRLKFNKENSEYFLRTSWWKKNVDWNKSLQEIKEYFKEENNYYNCKPTCLIVPLDRKIKVSYEEIIDKVKIIKYLFFTLLLDSNFIWDIFLIKSNTYKEQIKKQVTHKDNLHKLLCESLPQYIWVVQAYPYECQKEPTFDFIFDSVEMPYDGKPFLTNIYSESFKNCLPFVDTEIQDLFSKDIEKNTEESVVNTAYEIFTRDRDRQQIEDKTVNDLNDVMKGIISNIIQTVEWKNGRK